MTRAANIAAGTLVEVPKPGPYDVGGEFGPEPKNVTPPEVAGAPDETRALTEGAPAKTPEATTEKPANGRTIMSRLALVEDALSDLHARHTALLERNVQLEHELATEREHGRRLEGDLAALRAEVGGPEAAS